MYRVKQFFGGLIANIPDGYDRLLNGYLEEKEKQIFMKLPRHEKKHAIDTAYTMKNFNLQKDRDILIKAALLHDIGKIGGSIGLIKKSILVLADKFFPNFSHKLSLKLNMFNIYYNHPALGAKILEDIGTDVRVILLVRNHHSENCEIDGIELLKKADGVN